MCFSYLTFVLFNTFPLVRTFKRRELVRRCERLISKSKKFFSPDTSATYRLCKKDFEVNNRVVFLTNRSDGKIMKTIIPGYLIHGKALDCLSRKRFPDLEY